MAKDTYYLATHKSRSAMFPENIPRKKINEAAKRCLRADK